MQTSKAAVGRTPRIVDRPAQRMAVVYTKGDPHEVASAALPALYRAVYALKFALKKQQGREFQVGCLRARWPVALTAPRQEWIGCWGVPIPDDTTDLVQSVPGVEVKIETWAYGPVAEVLHVGPYRAEEPTVVRLLDWVAAQGYQPVGMHEEEYLTAPTARTLRTIIRYPVQPLADPVAGDLVLAGSR